MIEVYKLIFCQPKCFMKIGFLFEKTSRKAQAETTKDPGFNVSY